MKRIIPLLLCTALGACASPEKTQASAPDALASPAESTSDSIEEAVQMDVIATLPEVRYYMIADA
jgi:hypothetical protein